MHIIIQIFTLLGALGMFLYGMTLMSGGLQKAAGNKLRQFLASMTSTGFKRVLTGVIITALIQSSSATTIMVVSFVNAGLMSLANAIGVIMGANIGTTLVSWIIAVFGFSVDIASFAVPLMAFGFILTLSKKNKHKNLGELIIGFSIMFIGLSLLKDTSGVLLDKPEVLSFLKKWTSFGFGSVLVFLAVGTILTIILQASSATMAITMVMVNFGWIPFEMAAAMVLGENIGTTITANIAASVGNASAKRAARAHTLFNVFGVIWVLIVFNPFMKLVGLIVETFGLYNPITADFTAYEAGTAEYAKLQTSLLYGVSTLHTLFNLINTLILIWFVPYIVRIVTWLVKNPKGEEEFRLKYISSGNIQTAELALDEARQEIIHFGEICRNDFNYIRQAINEPNPDKFSELNQKLVKYEEITDRIEFEIASYLNEVSKGEVSEDADNRIKAMYKIIGELESLGDSGEAIGRMLQRKNAHNQTFDEEMMKKLNQMLDVVEVAYGVMNENLAKPYGKQMDISNAIDAEHNINECRNSLREEHIVNIENNNYNYHTGVYYMDVVSELEKMGDFMINISQAVAMVK